jgi:DNA helicase HerA-like ATPase
MNGVKNRGLAVGMDWEDESIDEGPFGSRQVAGRPARRGRERVATAELGNQMGLELDGLDQASRVTLQPADRPSDGAVELLAQLEADVAAAGGAWKPGPEEAGAVGRTMFDLPSSQDNSITVLLPDEQLNALPSQALLRIRSRDGHTYIGTVVAGPFHEPDALRADSSLLVTVVTRSAIFVPPYHGRVQVEILGEELANGKLVPPRLRPQPNSAVVPLTTEEVVAVLHAEGDLQIGQLVGLEAVNVGIPSFNKAVLPRHTAILGTTGSGKSTTVARLVEQAQASGCAVVLLDVEGEYTRLHEPTDDPTMLAALGQRGLAPRGVEGVTLYHLVGRETANPEHPRLRPFSLQFARLSPYAVAEILDLTEPQSDRFHTAYEVASAILRDLDIFPERGQADQERQAQELDLFERGYPRLQLEHLIDAASACLATLEVEKPKGKNQEAPEPDFNPRSNDFKSSEARSRLLTRAATRKTSSPISWRTLLSKLWRLWRLKVFDAPDGVARPLSYKALLREGQVAILDLSDTGSPELNNLVIADLLRGIQEAQDQSYAAYDEARRRGWATGAPARTLIVIEEAHEFLSAERSEKMPILFQQVARIAKRGRKRWLGLVFVTQLPQHLPRQLFGLVNSYVLHKISDPRVVDTLQRTVSGIDQALWGRLPGLAPGQAIVAFPHLARPLLVAVDPAVAKLRLVE